MLKERFAPSPTGYLHLGHAYSAMLGYDCAQREGAQWLLRIEDSDFTRCRTEYIEGIYEDLAWLGLSWPKPVLLQSTRQEAYNQALARLQDLGVIYGCQCTRKDLALSAPHAEDANTPNLYPGTCRDLHLKGDNLNLRLNARRAMEIIGPQRFLEIGTGEERWINVDWLEEDVVIARKDIGTSYHLAVVVDDAHQEITHVTRGQDLFSQTHIHVVLQALLDLPTPIYRHHALIRDENGKRLAKRYRSREIRNYRENGYTPEDIRKILELSASC